MVIIVLRIIFSITMIGLSGPNPQIVFFYLLCDTNVFHENNPTTVKNWISRGFKDYRHTNNNMHNHVHSVIHNHSLAMFLPFIPINS